MRACQDVGSDSATSVNLGKNSCNVDEQCKACGDLFSGDVNIPDDFPGSSGVTCPPYPPA